MKLVQHKEKIPFLEKTLTLELTGREAVLINAALCRITVGTLNNTTNHCNPRDFAYEELVTMVNFLDKLPEKV